MIEFRNVTFKYEGARRLAMEDFSLTVQDGEFLGITGPGGSGKTTILYCISGVIPHFLKGDFYGEVLVDGTDTLSTTPVELARRVGLVMQDTHSQFVALEVEDEIRFGLDNFGVDEAEYEDRISSALRDCGLSDCRNALIRDLSGGQQRKAAIAAILALRPSVLLLDEPTGELDPPSKRRVFETLADLNSRGVSIVVAEKNTRLLEAYCSRTIVLEDKAHVFGANPS